MVDHCTLWRWLKESNDWTIRYKNKIFQIIDQDNLLKTNKTIEVREYLDNTIYIFHKGNKLVFSNF